MTQQIAIAGSSKYPVDSAYKLKTSKGTVLVRGEAGENPVVLLHGWCADGLSNWFKAWEPLKAAGYTPIAFDAPGHGGSSLHGRFEFESCIEVLGTAFGDLGLEKAVFVGYSMGGPMSQTWARERKEQVAGLVEVATAAHIIPSGVSSVSLGIGSRVWGAGSELIGATKLFSRLVGDTHQKDEINLRDHFLWSMRHASKRGLAEAGKALSVFDSRGWSGTLDCPAACVITTKDRAVPVDAQRELAILLKAGSIDVPYGHNFCLRDSFGQVIVEAVNKVTSV